MHVRFGWDRDQESLDSDRAKIYERLREVLRKTLAEEDIDLGRPERLYQFRSLPTARKLRDNCQLWARSVRQMNDSLEIHYAWSQAIRELYDHSLSDSIGSRFYRKINPHAEHFSAFTVCFSDPGDNPDPLWGEYAAGGDGVALGFAPDDLRELKCFYNDWGVSDRYAQLVPVIYDPEIQSNVLQAIFTEYREALDDLDKEPSGTHLSGLFGGLLPAMKSPRWEDENEWRLVIPILGSMDGEVAEHSLIFREGEERLFMKLHWCGESGPCPPATKAKGDHAAPVPIQRIVANPEWKAPSDPAQDCPRDDPDLISIKDDAEGDPGIVSSLEAFDVG